MTAHENKKEESLAERSARLEAEAQALIEAAARLEPEDIPTEESAPAGDNAALQAELDQAKDQMMRALAEAENARKRAQREREDATKYAVSGFAKGLLEVSDNLRRALEAVPEDLAAEPRLQNLIEGIEATERSLLSTFERSGIRKIIPLDEIFDPNFHEVMFEAPMPGKPAGTIIQVVEPGYMIHDRLLRPARVGVAKDTGETPKPGDGGVHPGGHIDTSA